jgi:signal transduction histidine kinase/CheY-like chemotaxis protein
VKAFDWIDVLRRDSVLSTQDDETLRFLVSDAVSKEIRYEPGDVIIRQGEIGDSIFFIGAGLAEAVLFDGRDQAIVLSVIRRGETFGEMGFFERRPRSATVRARERCLVLEVNGQGLRSLADAQPDVGFRILLQVSERLRAKNEQILGLHLASVEAANRAKDEFMAMLGHELRNPLGAITTAVHVLNSHGTTEDAAARLKGIIARQAQHLSHLVDDLLDVSKLVSGKIVLHRQPEDLRDVAVRALASFQQAGNAAHHVVSVTGAPVRVHGDVTRLEQVVTNLLDNAVKFTPGGGRVDVTIAADGADAVLTVRDTGIGIPPEVLPAIFDMFVQANPTVARSEGGLGLGLTIVRRLVELHGGTVAAASAGAQRGAEFTVRLPRIPDATTTPLPLAAPGRSPRARDILIVEDNADFREGLRLLLESWGHRVQEAGTGAHGLDIVRARQPEIVLVDLGLPDIDGYAVARAVRSAPGGDAILLVAVTGYGAASDRRRADDAGFDAHLTKPVSPQELTDVLLL